VIGRAGPAAVTILHGDARTVLATLATGSVRCCVTSPPYWSLRDYEHPLQVGAEPTVDGYVENVVTILREVRRCLSDDGTLWLNLGDAYTSGGRKTRAPDKRNKGREMGFRPPTPEGLKKKDLIGLPWRVAFALQADGWYLRADCIWEKANAQPESVADRPTRSHEYVFLLSKSERYLYRHAAVAEPARSGGKRRRRSVWTVPTEPFKGAHFAVMPAALAELCIEAGSEPGDTIIDPFFGSGTTAVVALGLGRGCVGIELNPEYVEIAKGRIAKAVGGDGRVGLDETQPCLPFLEGI
jgi:site-specific DNA-methyltransferase (adenine-specific)/site-specific DNA-methyltransferase (cytosine-N4-specific)